MIWAGLPAFFSRKHVNKDKIITKTDLNPCDFDQNTCDFLYTEKWSIILSQRKWSLIWRKMIFNTEKNDLKCEEKWSLIGRKMIDQLLIGSLMIFIKITVIFNSRPLWSIRKSSVLQIPWNVTYKVKPHVTKKKKYTLQTSLC